MSSEMSILSQLESQKLLRESMTIRRKIWSLVRSAQ
jgi:hypothetical protein